MTTSYPHFHRPVPLLGDVRIGFRAHGRPARERRALRGLGLDSRGGPREPHGGEAPVRQFGLAAGRRGSRAIRKTFPKVAILRAFTLKTIPRIPENHRRATSGLRAPSRGSRSSDHRRNHPPAGPAEVSSLARGRNVLCQFKGRGGPEQPSAESRRASKNLLPWPKIRFSRNDLCRKPLNYRTKISRCKCKV